MTKQLDSVALWRAIQEQKLEDEIDDLIEESDESVDAYITANGGDPKAIREGGQKFVDELLARQKRLAWHDEAAAKLARFRTLAEEMRTKEKLPRAELLRRIEAARHDPRFTAQVSAMFYKKTTDASTDEELKAMLDQMALLARLDDEEKAKKKGE